MNPKHSVALAIASIFGFTLIVSADKLLLTEELYQTTFQVEQQSDEAMETSHNAVFSQELNERELSPSEKQAIEQHHQAGQPLWSLPAYSSASTGLKGIMLDHLVGYLVSNKAYAQVAELLSQIDQAGRIALKQQFQYAIALSKTNKLEQVEAAYRALLVAEPNHQAAAINLGLLYNKQDRYPEAIPQLKKAISISSGRKKAKAMSALATAYRKTQQLEKAEEYFQSAIEYRPNHPATWLKLALIQSDLNRPYQQVVMSFERAIALQPDYAKALRHLGSYQLQKLNFDAAISTLSQALRLSNNNEELHQLLAWAYIEAGQQIEAEKHWRWLSLNGKRANERLLASHMLKALKRQPHQLKPFNTQALHAQYAEVYLRKFSANPTWRVEDVQQFWGTELQLRAKHLVATQLLELEATAAALLVEQLVGLNLYRAEVHYLQSLVALALDKPVAALEAIDTALEVSSKNKNYIFHKLVLLDKTGQYLQGLHFINDLPLELQRTPSLLNWQQLFATRAKQPELSARLADSLAKPIQSLFSN